MSASPITYLEQKWSSGYSNNLLFESAVQTQDRKNIPALDYDSHRNVSNLGRRTMLSLGRWLFANFSTVRGALIEQAEYTASHYIWQSRSENKGWSAQALEWLQLHDRICDVRGQPFNMRIYRRNLVLSVLRDGDMLTVLVKSKSGYPFIQCIPAHRLGSRLSQYQTTVEGGPYDGARIVDGVIVDDYGAPLAYRVLGENPWDTTTFTDVPARDAFLSFIPEYTDQVRGFSAMGASLFDWQDVSEYRRFELMAQKVGAAITLIEKNEAGEAPPGADFIRTPSGGAATSGTASGRVSELIDGGLIRYLQSRDPNASIEAFKNDRPSPSQQSFEDKILRSALSGMHWSVDFSLKPGDVGRSSTRVVIEKINRSLKEKEELIVEPAVRRIDGFRLGVAMQPVDAGGIEVLPRQWDWYKFRYQGPARFTADARYDSQIDIDENRAGIKTLEEIAGTHGQNGEDIQDTLIAEEKRLQEKCKAAGVDPNRIKLLTPNGNASVDPQNGANNAAAGGASGAANDSGDSGGSGENDSHAEGDPFNFNIQLNTEQRRRSVKFKRAADGSLIGAEIDNGQ